MPGQDLNAVGLGSEALASQGSGGDESSLPKIMLTSIKLKTTALEQNPNPLD